MRMRSDVPTGAEPHVGSRSARAECTAAYWLFVEQRDLAARSGHDALPAWQQSRRGPDPEPRQAQVLAS